MAYNAPVGGIGAGVLAGGTLSALAWSNAGWLLMTVFVLVMAGVAVFAIVPRRRVSMRHVNPAEVRGIRPHRLSGASPGDLRRAIR